MSNDPVDAAIAAYQKHLLSGSPAPSLDQLTDDERWEALEVFDLMKDARGIDFNRSRPSLDWLVSSLPARANALSESAPGLSLDAIRGDVVSALGPSGEPIVDLAAESEGLRSDALLRSGSLRIRVQFRPELSHVSDLEDVDPCAAGGPIFGRFPDTAAVILVMNNPEFSSVAIGPFDVDDFIGTPDGQTHHPRIVRPVLGLMDTLRSVVEEFAPDLTGDDALSTVETPDLYSIIRAECATACAAVIAEGKKARTPAKVDAWSTFDARKLLTGLLEDAAAGKLDESDLDSRLRPSIAA